ncbi:Orexigenic neuropeptide QRFP [Tupaia chinensis]|uniref:Orexigenic neuropeptide QRFP n=1 Tax=Tupaia chinensis TaxID=246437 RepID=L8Y8W2_TUPCH|nr:Orexigenic neuropeptide QRFP [Tupaia chinensis]
MLSLCSLAYLLLLPLGTCLPLLDMREPADAGPGMAAEKTRAALAEAGLPYVVQGPSQGSSIRKPLTRLVLTEELQEDNRGRTDLEARFGRQADGGRKGTGKKSNELLDKLAQSFKAYTRQKGGFWFRYGRR